MFRFHRCYRTRQNSSREMKLPDFSVLCIPCSAHNNRPLASAYNAANKNNEALLATVPAHIYSCIHTNRYCCLGATSSNTTVRWEKGFYFRILWALFFFLHFILSLRFIFFRFQPECNHKTGIKNIGNGWQAKTVVKQCLAFRYRPKSMNEAKCMGDPILKIKPSSHDYPSRNTSL